MRTILAMICLLVFLTISCKKDTSPVSSVPDGAFEYQGFDTSGTQVISGWLKIDFTDSNLLRGTWNLSKIGDPPNIGHQVGEGRLEGSVEDSELWINLNPGVVDDNVYLVGELEGNEIEGNWHYSTFVGAINGGPFKAIKK